MKFKSKSKLKKIDVNKIYFWLSILISIVFLGFGFLFCNFITRLAEALRDLGVSVAYYFCGLFFPGENPITATVITPSSWQFINSPFEPLRLFPYTWEEFVVIWEAFKMTIFSASNFLDFVLIIVNILYYVSQFLIIFMPLFLALFIQLKSYTKVYNNDYNEESNQLKVFKKIWFGPVYNIKNFILGFALFVRNHNWLLKAWIICWLLYFNVINIVIEFLAYYLFFSVSFDVATIFGQAVKLVIDLTPMLRFLPVFVWIVLGIFIFNKACRSQAYMTLYHCERKNRGFINERGVVTIVYGRMGAGKTSLITSMGLSAEVELRDMAFEILLERDMMFPNFPWNSLREDIKRQIDDRVIVDIDSAKRWVATMKKGYDRIFDCPKWYKRQVKKRKLKDVTYGYDLVHYSSFYNNELYLVPLYNAIEDYTCAYFVYTVQTSLIISNYSVRVDSVISDLGNMPIWDSDFFERDPRLMDAYSRHSHIIDFDMLRLGKRMVSENPNRNAFGFGVYLISEIDKERKNALELQETKRNTDECNQKNDLFNSCLKMSRHACVIANKVFLKIICDLQRPEDWGAGGREVGEIVYIKDNGDLEPTLPFYSPYWLTEGLFGIAKSRFDSFYTKYIYKRADNTLLMYLLKNIFARLNRHYSNIKNLFGCQVLNLEVESGRMDGDSKNKKYYRMPKKDYSKRYSTNCLSAIFEGDEVNTISINDFIEYADIMATSDELALQNSHFQNDLRKMKEKYSNEK